MTYVVGFLPGIPALPLPEYQSWFDWTATFDLRHHFYVTTFLDPFVEISIGNAGRVHILKTQAGFGMSAVVARDLHFGLKAAYRFYTMPIPGITISQYPLRGYRLDFYCGM